MCGIAGVVSFEGPVDAGAVDALNQLQAHRGRDGEGRWLSPKQRAALGHRRLAIIDPSPGGAQPMSDPTGRFHVVFNGEIYNHRELAAAHGLARRSQSDTEVLLALLAREGVTALGELRGMFALALWDEGTQELLLARDRFGIKPLYVARSAKQIAFASEARALRQAGLCQGNIAAAGVLAYLRWGSLPPPLTIYEDVEALAPGTWLRFSARGEASAGSFDDAAARFVAGPTGPTATELRTLVRAAVEDTVRAHLVADVPVGIFLSGGIDSSALVSSARSVATGELRTYTVVSDDLRSSESRFAELVSARFGTAHHELHVSADAVAADLPRILDRLDQPTADAVNTYYVAQAVAETGLKAVLSGTGADEIFGGYPSFRRIPLGLRLHALAGPALRTGGAWLGRALPSWRRAKWRHFCAAGELGEAYRAQRGLLMPEELASWAGPALQDRLADAGEAVAAVEERLFHAQPGETAAAGVARLELRHYLGVQLLRDIDAMSMAHTLEVRVPFVDHELLAVVWPALARHPALLRNKRLLYESLTEPLPPAVYQRKKQGFTLPMAAWIRGPLAGFVREAMRAAIAAGWVRAGADDELWRDFLAGQSHWSRPWALAVLGHFAGDLPRAGSRAERPRRRLAGG